MKYWAVRNCADCGSPFTIRGARSRRCDECQPKHVRKTQRDWANGRRQANPKWELWRLAKLRARKFDLPFEITEADIEIPATCPVLGIPVASCAGKPGPGSPTVDRIEPAKGYVPGNIQVISHRANVLKHDASLEELTKLGDWASARQLAQERGQQ